MKALSSFKLIYHLFAAPLFNTKSVSKLGGNFKTLSMVLKLKLEGMTWTVFQFFFSAKFQNFDADQQEKLTRSFKILRGGRCFLVSLAGLLTTSKNFPDGLPRTGVLALGID